MLFYSLVAILGIVASVVYGYSIDSLLVSGLNLSAVKRAENYAEIFIAFSVGLSVLRFFRNVVFCLISAFVAWYFSAAFINIVANSLPVDIQEKAIRSAFLIKKNEQVQVDSPDLRIDNLFGHYQNSASVDLNREYQDMIIEKLSEGVQKNKKELEDGHRTVRLESLHYTKNNQAYCREKRTKLGCSPEATQPKAWVASNAPHHAQLKRWCGLNLTEGTKTKTSPCDLEPTISEEAFFKEIERMQRKAAKKEVCENKSCPLYKDENKAGLIKAAILPAFAHYAARAYVIFHAVLFLFGVLALRKNRL